MRRDHVLRFDISDRELHDRLASDPLPLGLEEVGSTLDASRVLYFDTVERELDRKGVTVRLRYSRDVAARLLVEATERQESHDATVRRRVEAEVQAADPAAAFSGDSEPARWIRGLTDPARLTAVLELDRLDRIRTGRLDGSEEVIEWIVTAATVRHEEIAGEFRELEVRVPDALADELVGLVEWLEERYGLQPELSDTVARARDLVRTLEADALSREIRAAREVAVVPYDRGRIALLRTDDGRLRAATGAGSGAEACQRALRAWFGRAQGRIRLLGRSAAAGHRPALETWLAEGVDASELVDEGGCIWMPLDDALARAGERDLRDGRTLAALLTLARTDLAGHPATAADEPSLPVDVPAPERELEPLLLAGADLQFLAYESGDPEAQVPSDLLLNAELSRLAFDERILVIAEDPSTPLLERLRFVSMFGSRLDDFFMTRVAEAKARVRKEGRDLPDGFSPEQQLDAIRIRARRVLGRAQRTLQELLLPELREAGIQVLDWEDLDPEERTYVRDRYARPARTMVTPHVTDPSHPFPHMRNLRPAIGAMILLPASRREHFIALQLPGELPRFIPLPGDGRFVPLDQVIMGTLEDLYPGVEVLRAHTFRVTRSANVSYRDEPNVSALQSVEEEVVRRPFRHAVRLEVEASMPPSMRNLLFRRLQFEAPDSVSALEAADVYAVDGLIDLTALQEIVDVDRPELKFGPLRSEEPFSTGEPLVEQVRERDRLVRFPYDSFDATIARLMNEAADDPDVLSVKITLYRTNPDSPVVRALARARAAGKDASALVELKASFDERRNIEWARSLEAAGIHVVFSPARFKVHAKTAMIIRREADGIRRYAYIGTGNLNAETASTYTDVGLLTDDAEITEDVSTVFDILTGYSAGVEFRRLLVSPFNLRRRLLEMIDREIEHARAGRGGRIRAQMNGLSDRRLIAALYRASAAGVEIDLAVREICRLRPGIDGVSENIRVVSLLGRLLQHSRIYHFDNAGDPEYFIGSADWRPRNLDKRVEVVTPIRDAEHRRRLDAALADVLENPDAWSLTPDGTYVRGTEVIRAAEISAPAGRAGD